MDCLEQALNILIFETETAGTNLLKKNLEESTITVSQLRVVSSITDLLPLSFLPDIIFIYPNANYTDIVNYYSSSFPQSPVVLVSLGKIQPGIADDVLPQQQLSPFVLQQVIRHNILLKKSNRQLKKVVERFELLAKATNDIVWDWQLSKHRSIWIGPGLQSVLGYDETLIKVDSEFWERGLHPDDKIRVINRLNSFFIDKQLNRWEEQYRFKAYNGAYRHFHDRGYIIYENGIAVRMIGIMEDITAKIELEEKLDEQLMLKQKQIAEAVVTAQEKERTEIGKELHDNVNQLLSASKLFIDASFKDELRREILLTNASGYITNAIEEIRALSKVLHAPLINELGLCESILILAEDIIMLNEVKIAVDLQKFDESDLNENFKITIYRIIQEQLTNILKHAKAQNASIKLSSSGKVILLEVSDDGIGFDTKEKRYGIGLSHIKSRASMYEGHLSIISKPGKGSCLKIKFPATRAAILV